MTKTKPKNILVHLGRKPRFERIAAGFLAGHSFTTFQDVGLRVFGPTPSEEALSRAIKSGQTVPKSGVANALRRRVLIWQYRSAYRRLRRGNYDHLLVWNGVKGHRALLAQAAKDLKIGVIYFEEAPLPKRITVDTAGVNYELSLPRDPEFFERFVDEIHDFDPEGWRDLRADLKSRAATYNKAVGQGEADQKLAGENYIFCPLQVPGDSQITVFGDWIASVTQLIEVLKRASAVLPDGWHIRVKEHPSSRVSLTDKIEALADDKLRLDNQIDTMAQVERAAAVLTINSSVGLEAFFFDKPVLTLGHAFYGFGGLAYKANSEAKLFERLREPENLRFDPLERARFMTYLAQVQFPKEQDLVEGKFNLSDLLARNVIS